MIGLDVTHQAVVNDVVTKKIAEVGTEISQFVLDLFAFFTESHVGTFGMNEPPVHDPCAVAYCIDPSIVKTVRVPVEIETLGNLTAGRTVVDFRQLTDDSCRTSIGLELDFDRFWELVIDSIRAISK